MALVVENICSMSMAKLENLNWEIFTIQVVSPKIQDPGLALDRTKKSPDIKSPYEKNSCGSKAIKVFLTYPNLKTSSIAILFMPYPCGWLSGPLLVLFLN